MTGGEIRECAGICMNGGICSNGVCQCKASYEGVNCQYKKEVITLESGSRPDWGSDIDIDLGMLFFYLGTILAIIILFAVSFYLFQYTQRKIDENKDRLRENAGRDRNVDMITANDPSRPNGPSRFALDGFQE